MRKFCLPVVIIGLAAAMFLPSVAQASGCKATTIGGLRKCFNTKLASQHKQIVTLQSKVAVLHNEITTGPVTSTAVSAAIANLNNEQASDTNSFNSIFNRINCWSDGLPVAEYPSSGSNPNPVDGLGTYLDYMHSDNPANNPVWHVLVNYC